MFFISGFFVLLWLYEFRTRKIQSSKRKRNEHLEDPRAKLSCTLINSH